MGLKADIAKMHYNKNADGVFFNLLKVCSLFYGLGSWFKNFLYDKNILKPKKVKAYVISVGNLTTGGVGKTPVVAEIAKYLVEKGDKVAIISRGYGGNRKGLTVVSDGEKTLYPAEVVGDEPFWLGQNVSGAYVITCKNRIKAAQYAIKKFGVTTIILDDGFQHRKLQRDLDIVLIDSEMGFGNENLLPAGPLREGLEAFDRMGKILVVSKNTEHTRAEKYANIMGKKLHKEAHVCYTEPEEIYNLFNPDEKLSKEEKVIAFSAIGQPQSFYKFLKDYNVVKTVDFDDHHNYEQKDIDYLSQVCAQTHTKSIITTEKDGGKLLGLKFKDLKVYVLKLQTKLDVEALLNEKS